MKVLFSAVNTEGTDDEIRERFSSMLDEYFKQRDRGMKVPNCIDPNEGWDFEVMEAEVSTIVSLLIGMGYEKP